MPGASILIVTNEPREAQDIESRLQHLGYAVAGRVTSGTEAVAKARELKPDLVLLDIMLQGSLDGIETAAQIRNHHDIPVIFLTAKADDQTLQRAQVSEAFGYLLKPLEDRELRMSIEMALHQHMLKGKLRDNQEWMATTLRCLGDAVVATDAHDRIQLINPMAETLTGWPRAEALGRKLADVFCLKDNQRSAPLIETFQSPAPTHNKTIKLEKNAILLARDAHSIPIDYSAAPIMSHNDNFLGVVVVFRDVRDRCQSEVRELQLQERLARAKRMESLGLLAGGVANQLHKILDSIADYPDLIKERLPADEATHADLAMIKNSSRKALDIVHDLLILGGIGHAPKEIWSLNELVTAALDSATLQSLQAQAPMVTVTTNLASEVLSVTGFKPHLQAVVTNLLINAFAAMPEGGRLVASTALEELNQAHDGYELIAPGKYVVLRVAHSGQAISAKDINQIFEPFYTHRGLGWEIGSGLGLAVVYSVVKDHQGFLDVSLNEDGADFSVYLPLANQSGAEVHPSKPLDYQGTETILVVNDNEEERQAIVRWLRGRGYKVLVAANGKSAFEIFQTENTSLETPIDLVILDMIMADAWDGLDTYRNMLATHPGQKAIILSGFTITGRIQETMRLGAARHLQKPFIMEELGQAVRQTLDQPNGAR